MSLFTFKVYTGCKICNGLGKRHVHREEHLFEWPAVIEARDAGSFVLVVGDGDG